MTMMMILMNMIKKFKWGDDDDNFDINKDDIGVNNIDDDDNSAFNDAEDGDVNHIIHSTETRHNEL